MASPWVWNYFAILISRFVLGLEFTKNCDTEIYPLILVEGHHKYVSLVLTHFNLVALSQRATAAVGGAGRGFVSWSPSEQTFSQASHFARRSPCPMPRTPVMSWHIVHKPFRVFTSDLTVRLKRCLRYVSLNSRNIVT